MNDASIPGHRNTAGIASIVLVVVKPSSIDNGIITFTFSKSWFEKYSLMAKDIVLMHTTDAIWTEFSTTNDQETGDTYYFYVTMSSFSYFAVTTRTTETTGNSAVTPTLKISSDTLIKLVSENVVTPGTIVRKVESYQANITTTAAASHSQETPTAGGFPFFMIIGGLAVIAIIAIGSLYIRRWGIQRQNPAPFRK
ncbi:MAG: PGF-pre-PGF domain-containing protein [Methanomicrobiales archaeon]